MKTKSKKAAKSAAAGTIVTTKKPRAKDAVRIKRIGPADHKVDLSDYVPVRSASGNSSLDNGDDVAVKLRGRDIKEVYGIVAKTTGESERNLRKLYGHLNVGMQRMNLGNKYRGALRAE